MKHTEQMKNKKVPLQYTFVKYSILTFSLCSFSTLVSDSISKIMTLARSSSLSDATMPIMCVGIYKNYNKILTNIISNKIYNLK